MNEKVMVSPEIQSEAVVLPQIVSIKQASSVWACLNITSAAFAGKCRAWHFSRALNGISTLERWLTTSTVERQLLDLSRMRA